MPWVTIGQSKIHYDQRGASVPPIIFIHGAGGSGKVWWNQLGSIDTGAIAVDLPGHGQSAGRPFEAIPDTAEFIIDLAKALSIPKAVLAGHSMGGAVALEAALQSPEMFAGLVLIGTGAKLRVAPAILDILAKGEFPFRDSSLLFGPGADSEAVKNAMLEMRQVSPDVFLTDFRACDNFDRVKQISELKLPCRIIVGDQDVLTPVKYSRFLQEQIAGSGLDIIPGAGHLCMLEKPREVNQAINEFVRSS